MIEQNEAKDYLSELPVAMLLHILQFLSDYENKSVIPRLSSHYYAVSSEHFIDHIYGRSLKFGKWQKAFIGNLENNVSTFKNKFQVSLLNRPDAPRVASITERIHFFFQLLLSVTTVYKAYDVYFKNDPSYTAELNKPAPLSLVRLLSLVFVVSSMILTLRNLPLRNNRYHARYITQEHIDALNKLYETNNFLMNQPDARINWTTVSQMLILVDQSLAETKNTANLLIKFFEGKRFSPIKTLTTIDIEDLNKTSPDLKKYSLAVLGLWSTSTKNPSIIPEELLSDESLLSVGDRNIFS